MKSPELLIYYMGQKDSKLVAFLVCSQCRIKDCPHWPELTKPRTCKRGEKILFARYHKTKKMMPLRADTKESHFADCKFAEEFRRKK